MTINSKNILFYIECKNLLNSGRYCVIAILPSSSNEDCNFLCLREHDDSGEFYMFNSSDVIYAGHTSEKVKG